MHLYIPPVVDGNPITARVPGFESDTINVVGLSPNMGNDLAARFRRRTLLHPRRGPARRARGGHRGQRGGSLFPEGDAVDGTFMMDGAEYTIIGVYAKAKGGFFGENGQDNAIVIPLHTAESRYPQIDRYMITAKAKSGKRQEAFDEVDGTMRRLRHLATDARTTISPSPRPTRSSSSSTASPA